MRKVGRVLRVLFACMYLALAVWAVGAHAWWAVLVLLPILVLRLAAPVLRSRRM
jgi:hypothetical protein